MKRNKMKNLKNTTIVLGAIATAIILVSSVTAVSQVSSITIINTTQTKDKEDQVISNFEELVKNNEIDPIIDISKVKTFEDLYKNEDFIAFMNSPDMKKFLQSKTFQDFYNSEPIQKFINSKEFLAFRTSKVIEDFLDGNDLLIILGAILVGFAAFIFGVLTWIFLGPLFAVVCGVGPCAAAAAAAFIAAFQTMVDVFEEQALLGYATGFILGTLAASWALLFCMLDPALQTIMIAGLILYPFACAALALILYGVIILSSGDGLVSLAATSARKSFI